MVWYFIGLIEHYMAAWKYEISLQVLKKYFTRSRYFSTLKETFRARSIQPKFQPVRPGKVDHLKRWTRFFETFPVGPNRSIEFWTEISGNFGWMDRALRISVRPCNILYISIYIPFTSPSCKSKNEEINRNMLLHTYTIVRKSCCDRHTLWEDPQS